MDEGGVAAQVLSMAGAVNSIYLTNDHTQAGEQLARESNEGMKNAVDKDPKRFKAFAELPFHERKRPSNNFIDVSRNWALPAPCCQSQ